MKHLLLFSAAGDWLCNFRWFRKWIGGHWEQWWLDVPFTESVWFLTNHTSPTSHIRPHPLCRGTPRCEDYPSKLQHPYR